MKVGIVTDEISNDFGYAVRQGGKWGIKDFEVRRVNSGRVPDISEAERATILRTVKDCSINIISISPGLFKIPLDCEQLSIHSGPRLYESFEFAHLLGTDKIGVFGFLKPEEIEEKGPREKITGLLGEASEKARKEGILLLLENEAGCWADTGQATAEIVSLVNHPNLRVNWDPGNALRAGETPFPDGYEKVKHLVSHVHVKDLRIDGDKKEWVALGKGQIDWQAQLQTLDRDGYCGFYVIETHCAPREENSRDSVKTLFNYLSRIF